jgi:murein DD-endopeptidase MepM/ murein hydrolase activator NlpD
MNRPGSLLALLVSVSLILSACSGLPGEPVAVSSVMPSAPPPPAASPSQTEAPQPTATPTPTPSLAPTASPIPCDPAAGFCVENGHFHLDRPIALPGVITVDPTYTYGTTQNGKRDPHHGVEFYNGSGTPVLAAADGLVAVAGKDDQVIYGPVTNFYGNLVVLEHHFPDIDRAVYTLYGHLSIIDVRVGQSVHAGEEIGKVGSSGEAIGSHLHFEVRLGRNSYDSNRNPVLWLKPLVGEDGSPFGVIAGRLQDGQGNPVHTRSLNLQYFPDPAGPPAAAYPSETYATEKHPVQSDDSWKENFSLGDIPAGHYRLSLVWGGKVLEDWADVQPGKVTVVTFIVK